MKWAIFSDVHGNLPALETFLEKVRASVDRYVCLGDVVNYGPWNDECLLRILDLPRVILLRGNHEDLFLKPELCRHELPLVREFFKCSYAHFTRRDLIENLPEETCLGPYRCRHALPGLKLYPNTQVDIKGQYILGHNHWQFRIQRDGTDIVSVGSIGQNRADAACIQYAVYDDETGGFSMYSESYPVNTFIETLRAYGYSAPCIDYYRRKIGAASSMRASQ